MSITEWFANTVEILGIGGGLGYIFTTIFVIIRDRIWEKRWEKEFARELHQRIDDIRF